MFILDVVFDRQNARILNQPLSSLKSILNETPFILKVAYAHQLVDMVLLGPDGGVLRSSLTANVVFLTRNSARLDTIVPFTVMDLDVDDIVNANPRPPMVSTIERII